VTKKAEQSRQYAGDRTETRSQEGFQEFRERSGCVNGASLDSLNASKIVPVSLSLKEGFLSRIVISWRLEPPGKTILETKCLRTALSCATVVPHFI